MVVNNVSGATVFNNNVNTISSATNNYEIPNKKLMGSFENVLEPVSSEESSNGKMYKVNLNILPIFVMELVAFACLGGLAYVLKFTKTFPVLIRGFHCDDLNAYSYPKNGSTDFHETTANVEPVTLYSVSLGVPIFLIFIGEIGFFIFSRKKKVVRGGCISCKLYLPLRRIIRFLGVYLFGYISLTILVVSLKLCTGRLRPYFLEECGPTNLDQTSCYPGQYMYPICSESEENIREARMSFPSYYAAMSAYSALFITVYLDFVLAIQASRLLRPSIVFLMCSLAILCGTLRAALHFNHWEDIVVGYILGIVTAFYLTIFILCRFGETKNPEVRLNNEAEGKDTKPLFYKYFHIPHVSYQSRVSKEYPAGGSYCNNSQHVEESYCNISQHKPAFQSTDFQKDLHQRIEDFNRRQSLNSQ